MRARDRQISVASAQAHTTVTNAAAPPCECEIDGDSRVAKVNGKDVSAAALRDVSVMDRRGATTNLGEQIGDKGVLVLLRHLG